MPERTRARGRVAALAMLLLPCFLPGANDLYAATVLGRIKTQDGRPIRGVKVTLRVADSRPGGSTDKTATTGKDGEFTFPELPPGGYLILAEKNGWYKEERRIDIREDEPGATIEVAMEMRLTFASEILGAIQLGSNAWVVLFGLLILAVNFFVVPLPWKEVSIAGWAFIVLGIAIASVKLGWSQFLELAAIGLVAGGLIQWYGGRVGTRKQRRHDEAERKERDARERERERVASLVGRQGVAVSDLKPCGDGNFDGETIEVQAESGLIPKGTRIVITRSEGGPPTVGPQQATT